MRSIDLVLLAVLASSCSSAERRQHALYEAAREDVRRGAIASALARIGQGEAARGTPSTWIWTFRLLRAEALLLQRKVSEALGILSSLPPLDAPNRPLEARRLYLQGLARIYQGRLPEALDILEEARRHAETADGPDEVLMDIDALHGQALLRARRWQEGDAALQEVLARASARGSPYHQAIALMNLGSGRVSRNRFDEALRYFERVLDIKTVEPYTIYGGALSNAGLCHARLGQFDQAIDAQQRAVQSHERRDLPTYLGLALGELGNTYVFLEDYPRALQHLSRALDVALAQDSAADAAVWAGNLAKVAIEMQDFDRAERFNTEAMRLKSKIRASTVYNTLYSADIAAGRGRPAEAGKLFQDALASSASDPGVQWEAHNGLARLALAAGRAGAAVEHFGAALRLIEQTRADLLKAEYRITFLTRVIRFYQHYVDTLMAAGQPERALEVADSSRGVVLAERMGAAVKPQTARSADLVAAVRRSRTIWLAYWLAPARSYVWVVTPGGVRFAALPSAAEIERSVAAYRELVEKSSVNPLAEHGAGDALYTTLIGPIAKWIPPHSSIRIVSDGALHGLNFETLPVNSPRRHYWLEDATVAMAPSLGLLGASPAAAVDPALDGSLLLVGDATPRLREFPRLGYAPVEMRAVARHFDATTTVRQDGDGASPANYFAAGPERFSVIHFTAHASANRTSPLDSAVILAGPAGADKLYARDVADRPLRAALVTISACRSAGDRAYTGEGLVGFSWAFLRAGARQVIAGLWDVDDQSTATLMDSLYAGMAAKRSAPEALREAKLTLMRQGGNLARPYYWGPFQVFTVTP